MEWKNVNIFISSTFNDMHAERDYLVKYVFPELAEWCDKRKLRLNDIDLRWGVTAEDSRTNRTIGICLRNIDVSRPFFVCFLGQRRGWKPEIGDVDETTLNEYPDLPKFIGEHSVTEMEIEHALIDPLRRLANREEIYPGCEERSLIFLRDGDFVTALSDAQKKVYTNDADRNPTEADRELSAFRDKLVSAFPRTKHYSCYFDRTLLSPELNWKDCEDGRGRLTNFRSGGMELKEVILSALKEAILKEYPDRTEEIETFTEADKRELFAENTALGYIERQEDLKAVNEYITGNAGNVLLLSATSGSGKSMLTARTYLWLKSQGKRMFYRSAGISEDTRDVLALFSGILTQAGTVVPIDLEDLTGNIDKYLYVLAQMNAILIVDALDQVPGGSEVLSWFPTELPQGLKVIFSIRSEMLTGSLRSDMLARRGAITYCLAPFNDEDKKILINSYLYSHFKKLDDEEIRMLLLKEGSENPLFLKTVVSELRVLGKFEKLREKITDLGNTPADAFNAILRRMENDYIAEGFDSKDTVSRLCSLLSCSRYGLSGKELDCIFSEASPDKDQEKIDPVIQVYLRQLREFLLHCDGVFDIRFSELRRAAAERYKNLSLTSHRMIADCLMKDLGDDLSGGARRSYAEVVYHYTMAGAHEAALLLSSYRFIKAKSHACGISSLISDYEFIFQNGNDILETEDVLLLGDILKALKKSRYIVMKKPLELPAQLSMRLSWDAGSKLLRQIKSIERETYICSAQKASSGEAMTFLDTDEAGTVFLSFVADGILLANKNGKIAVISDRDGLVIRTIKGPGDEINKAFLHGDILYTAQKNGTLSAYHIYTARKTASYNLPHEGFFSVISAGGKVFAGGKKKVYAFDEELKTIKVIGRHRDRVTCLTADERNVWSSGDDGRIIRYEQKSLIKKAARDLHFGKISFLGATDGMLLAGGFAETIHLIDPTELKVTKSTYTMNDVFTSDIKVTEGGIFCFSGSSFSIYRTDLTRMANPEGAACSFLLTDTDEKRMCFLTATGHIGTMAVADILMKTTNVGGPAELISVNSGSVLIAGAKGGIRLYDRHRDRDTVLGNAVGEDITSVAALENGFLLGRRRGQLMLLSNDGEEEDFIKYNDSINLDPFIPVTCLCSDGRHAAYQRYGQIVCVNLLQVNEQKILKGFQSADCMIMIHGRLYIADGNEVSVYRAEGLQKVGKYSIPGRCAKMIWDCGLIYLAMSEGDIATLDPNTGKSRILFRESCLTDFAVSGGIIAVTGSDMTLRVFKDQRVMASLTFDDVPNSVSMDGERIFVGMYGGEFLITDLCNPDNRGCEKQEMIPMPSADERQVGLKEVSKGSFGNTVSLLGSLFLGIAAAALSAMAVISTKPMTASVKYDANTLIWGALIMVLSWFGIRIVEAYQSRNYRKIGRIIPSTVMMTLAAVVFYMISQKVAVTWEAKSIIELNKRYIGLLAIQYPYIIMAFVNMAAKGRMRLLNKADKLFEIYIYLAALIMLATLILSGIW